MDLCIKQRNIPMCIFLTIITCGIYGLYWFVCLTDDVSTIFGNEYDTPGGIALVFDLITCGIYGYFWCYHIGQDIDRYNFNIKHQSTYNRYFFIALSFFWLDAITYAIAQNAINEYVESRKRH